MRQRVLLHVLRLVEKSEIDCVLSFAINRLAIIEKKKSSIFRKVSI